MFFNENFYYENKHFYSEKRPPTRFNKCLQKFTELLSTLLNTLFVIILAMTVIFIDLINASVNHIIEVVPLSIVRSPRGIDDMVAGENVTPELTLGAISSWLYVF